MADKINEEQLDFEEPDEAAAMDSVWELLTPEQKKYFKKLTEKNKQNMIYIG
jgi:Spy/CpxP family protein refolding chaperone